MDFEAGQALLADLDNVSQRGISRVGAKLLRGQFLVNYCLFHVNMIFGGGGCDF